jgi:hypothetical protein
MLHFGAFLSLPCVGDAFANWGFVLQAGCLHAHKGVQDRTVVFETLRLQPA